MFSSGGDSGNSKQRSSFGLVGIALSLLIGMALNPIISKYEYLIVVSTGLQSDSACRIILTESASALHRLSRQENMLCFS